MPAFASARSIRVCPGFCFAPAVITTTSAPRSTSTSSEPSTLACGTNSSPWFRSRTSASTFVRDNIKQPDLPRNSANQRRIRNRRADAARANNPNLCHRAPRPTREIQNVLLRFYQFWVPRLNRDFSRLGGNELNRHVPCAVLGSDEPRSQAAHSPPRISGSTAPVAVTPSISSLSDPIIQST